MDARPASLLVATLLATALVASTAAAQPFDHLQCFKIKDGLPRGTATADLAPGPGVPVAAVAAGCKIKLPARYFCTSVAKENLQPPPVFFVGGQEPNDYFCYRLACPKGTKPPRGTRIVGRDQFGERTVVVQPSNLVCVPAVQPQPSPSPTPALPPPCNQVGPPECGGTCLGGAVCVPLGGGCSCVTFPSSSPTPTSTPHTSPLPCNNSVFPQCNGDCGPFSQCFNFGSFCACEPPTPTPPQPTP